MNRSQADALSIELRALIQDSLVDIRHADGELTITVAAARIVDVLRTLRDAPGLAFTQMNDLSGVDYLSYGQADWVTQGATSSGFSRATPTFRRGSVSRWSTSSFPSRTIAACG